MRKKILITRLWPSIVIQSMRDRYDITVDDSDVPLSPQQIREAMTRFDAICPTITDRLDTQIFEQVGLKVRIISNFGAGVEHIDIDAAKRAGIVVTNTPDVLTQSTAELCILLMLMTARRAAEGERQVRARRWHGWYPTHLMGCNLQDKRLGFIGFGRIAQATACMAKSLWNMEIAYYGRRRIDAGPGVPEAEYHASLISMLEASDIVSVQCPGGKETHHLLNAEMIARMKPSAILINTARGSVVEERALADALQRGRLWGAGLDVYEREPQIEPALLALENVVLLPHLGSATIQTRTEMGFRAVKNIDDFFSGKEPSDRVTL